MFGCSAVMVAENVKSEQSEDTCSFDASLAKLWTKSWRVRRVALSFLERRS